MTKRCHSWLEFARFALLISITLLAPLALALFLDHLEGRL